MPTIRTVADLAALIRGKRIELALSQADLAARAGVSRKWIYEFEAGRERAELRLVLGVLDALGLDLNVGPAPEATTATELDELLQQYTRND